MRFTSWYENRRRPFNFETLSEPNKIIRSSSVNPLHLAVGIPPPAIAPCLPADPLRPADRRDTLRNPHQKIEDQQPACYERHDFTSS